MKPQIKLRGFRHVDKLKRIAKSTALKRVAKLTPDKDHRFADKKRIKPIKNINDKRFPNVRNKQK